MPDLQDQVFAEGTTILLVKKVGVRYRCIANPHPELL
ncbi:MAG: OB-fold-containig protein [Burkholderiales bacterium]